MIRQRFDAVLAIGFALMVACGPLGSAAHAEVGPPPPVAGEELTIRVLTIGSGDHPLLTLGESAIWIQDEHAGRGFVYDFGALKPNSLASVITWLTGRLKNRVSRLPIDDALQSFRSQNRTIQAQELDLTPTARLALRADVERAAVLPANREYDYDYDPFVASGATRVRDAIDRASGGRLRAAAQRGGPDGETLRQETRAAARNLFPAYLLLDLGQGVASDRPLGQWNRMFIPGEIQKTLRRVGRAGSWNDPPLMSSEGTIYDPHGEPPDQASAQPHDRGGGRLVVAGLAIGTVLALGGRAARRRPPLRVVFGTTMGMIGLLLGVLGSTLVVGWLFGNQLVARRNENILQLAPWSLALPVLAAGVAMGRRGATRAAFWVTAAAAALAAGGLLIKATPWFRQDNLPLIGFFLPIWAGLAASLRALGQK
jgi:hypothetical protein